MAYLVKVSIDLKTGEAISRTVQEVNETINHLPLLELMERLLTGVDQPEDDVLKCG